MKIYHVLAFYIFTPIDHPQEEVEHHHAFFAGRDATGRIYISAEGINGQMSASEEDAKAYMQWMHEDARFSSIDFKVHRYHEHVFPRMTVKVREQLVALDIKVNREDTAEHVSAATWKKMLEERDEQTILMDVRNDYEWEIGHFEGAILPNLETFRAFPSFAKQLKEEKDPKTTRIMMYCTGGIRCELYSALLKQEGFEHVVQLEGGVIKYGQEEGSTHWRGKLFVFDDRMAIPIAEDQAEEVISLCSHCESASDVHYNCANLDCNELFLSCPDCAERLKGCCSLVCSHAPRLRAYDKNARPKPFRRKHFYD